MWSGAYLQVPPCLCPEPGLEARRGSGEPPHQRSNMDPHTTSAGPETQKEEPPPFLGSWRRIYIAIVVYLVTVIALFGLFTRSLNR